MAPPSSVSAILKLCFALNYLFISSALLIQSFTKKNKLRQFPHHTNFNGRSEGDCATQTYVLALQKPDFKWYHSEQLRMVLEAILHILHNHHKCTVCVIFCVRGRLRTQNLVELEIFTVFMNTTQDLSKKKKRAKKCKPMLQFLAMVSDCLLNSHDHHQILSDLCSLQTAFAWSSSLVFFEGSFFLLCTVCLVTYPRAKNDSK